MIHWLEEKNYHQRKPTLRESKLDQYKPQIIKWLDTYPYSGIQILQRLRNEGYQGGATILQDYISKVRPRKTKAFLTLSFEPSNAKSSGNVCKRARSLFVSARFSDQ